jgi:2-polyprenyl-3-methyl-5-hydroxy-6-metoxy-1,4-benzoquinol methylase
MNERIPYKACPLCASPTLQLCAVGDCSRHPLYQEPLNPRIEWMRCTACGHVCTSGYYSDEACRLIFSKTNEHQQVGHNLEQTRGISARMIEKVQPYVASGRWLDIGFGNASLLFTALEYGYTPVGLDLREDNVKRLREFGIEGECVDILQHTPAKPYAVVSMADVLEHMPFPGPALRAVHGLLADNGILFVSMPNIEAPVWQAMDRAQANPYWGELEHYHNFGRTRLYALLREHGFEPVRYGISERYRACMEVISRKQQPSAPSQWTGVSFTQRYGG